MVQELDWYYFHIYNQVHSITDYELPTYLPWIFLDVEKKKPVPLLKLSIFCCATYEILFLEFFSINMAFLQALFNGVKGHKKECHLKV